MSWSTAMRISAAGLFLLAACSGRDSVTAPTDLPQSLHWNGGQPAFVQAAAADAGIFQFYECTGPAGTPSSFTAEKIELPEDAAPPFAQATAYRLTDGSAVFLALVRGDRHNPPGIDPSGVADTSCLVDTPLFGTLLFSGFLAFAG